MADRQQRYPLALAMLDFAPASEQGCSMTITNALAGIAVDNLGDALDFYERFFGREADARPLGDVAEWKLPGIGLAAKEP
ncbi:MAG: hypothetical protein EON47_21765, partial [Acetobacteraceae bacterium]